MTLNHRVGGSSPSQPTFINCFTAHENDIQLKIVDTTQRRNLKIIEQNCNQLSEFNQGKILLISPNYSDFVFWKNHMPSAEFTISTIHDWNLENVFKNSRLQRWLKPGQQMQSHKLFDLTIAQNVFMYLKEPFSSINHIASISDNLFIQDLKYRKRSKNKSNLGDDGDVTRYSVGKLGNLNQNPIDLTEILNTDAIKFHLEYSGEINDFHTKGDPPVHILAVIKLNSRSEYAEIRKFYPKFTILRFHIIQLLKNVKSWLLLRCKTSTRK